MHLAGNPQQSTESRHIQASHAGSLEGETTGGSRGIVGQELADKFIRGSGRAAVSQKETGEQRAPTSGRDTQPVYREILGGLLSCDSTLWPIHCWLRPSSQPAVNGPQSQLLCVECKVMIASLSAETDKVNCGTMDNGALLGRTAKCV